MTQVSMYASFFGLSEAPFSIAPDPRFLYMSKRHREAMAHLVYGIKEGGGFVQLTGEVGTGKTTLCRYLILKVPDRVDVALILNPQLSHAELLATLCDELKIEYPKYSTPLKILSALNEHLLEAHAQGKRTVLIIDEAQLLSRTVLEQVRILTNLETTKHKLLQIILIGQPELAKTLDRDDLKQLSQRITARYHLEPLNLQDTCEYVKYRLAVVGCKRRVFSKLALRRIYKYSGGVPRLINVISDRAMLGAYTRNNENVSAPVVRNAAKEVLGGSLRQRMRTWWAPVATLLVVFTLLFVIPYTRGSIIGVARSIQFLYVQTVESARQTFLGLIADSKAAPPTSQALLLSAPLATRPGTTIECPAAARSSIC